MVLIADKNESISEYRYKLDVKIEWYDNTEKNIIDKNYSGFGAYGLREIFLLME